MAEKGNYGVPKYLPGSDRVLCDVLHEMRDCWKTRNFAAMKGLIEEAQSMGNQMEAGLTDKRNYSTLCSILRKALRRLRDGEK